MIDRLARKAGMRRFDGAAVWLAALLCSLAPPAFAACTLEKIAELPVEMVGTRPLVSAKINGTEVKFLADSGAFYSIISPAAAAQFNLRRHPINLTIRGVGGDVTPSLVTVDKLTLAGVDLPRIDFLTGGGEAGEGAIGLFGQNVLGYGDAEYDLANGVIRLIHPNGCGDTALAYWTHGAPFSVIDIQPLPGEPSLGRLTPLTTAVAFVNGKKIRVLFDTGASYSELSLKAAADVGVTPAGPGVSELEQTMGLGRKMTSTWIGPFASFKIGDEEIRNTKLRFSEAGLDGADMLLGADFFLSHRVYVANSQHKLYFTYNGGPVFRLGGDTLAQAGQNQPPRASPIVANDKTAPTDAEGLARRAAALAGRRDFDQALVDLDHAIALSPKTARFRYARGVIYLEKHQDAQAMQDFDQSLTLEPNDPAALLQRAELRNDAHDEAGAKADLKAASSFAPKEADIRLDLAQAYLRLNLTAEAIAEFDLWIAAHPDDARRPWALGGRCTARGLGNVDLDMALKDCDGALKAIGKSPAFLNARALVFLRQSQFEKSIDDFNSALAIEPKNARSLYGRGVAKTKSGQAAGGKADIAAAIALAPGIADEAKKFGLTP